MKHVINLFSFVLILSSCNKEKRQAEKDEEIIKKYITNNNLNAKPTGSGLYYVVETAGTGDQPTSSSQVKVAYTGYFTNAKVFDESPATGVTFGLQQVIKGWTEGIPFFKEGGKGILLIPSKLGYGASGTNGIPANSVLIFNVELIDVL